MVFSIMAVDGGYPPCSGTALIHMVVLDINDNIPAFTQTSMKSKYLKIAPRIP